MELSLPAKCPLALVIAANLGEAAGAITRVDGRSLALTINKTKISRAAAILRAIAREIPASYGNSIAQEAEVDHWIDVSFRDINAKATADALSATYDSINTHLMRRSFLLGNEHAPSMADAAVFGAIMSLGGFDGFEHITRWVEKCKTKPAFSDALASAAATLATKTSSTSSSSDKGKGKGTGSYKDQGNFIELEGATKGEVIVRFPPEASGYLHIGHAKAAMLNQYFATTYEGKLRMRFDDTNPAKENAEFERVILEDLKLLGINYDLFSHTSDHFDTMIDLMAKMIKEGNAYVDDTAPELLAAQRMERSASKCRDHTVEENLKLWDEMLKGTTKGRECIVRAKIDYKSDNGALRDPTMFRCKVEPHIRTGDKYKAYPTYDFACPIVDSIEGVTHALRTTEYNDRDEQYAWIAKALGLRVPRVWAFSRLNLINTVMSKRQLTWFVQQGVVDGWSDPRFPTVRGMLRQGLTVQGLREFILGMGSSRNATQMSWDKIWAINKKVLEPVAPRHTALDVTNIVNVNVLNVDAPATREQPLHPKNPAVGTKAVVVGPKILIEQEDAQRMSVGDKITLMEWGNAYVKAINKLGPIVDSMDIEVDEKDTDYAKTLKVTWLADDDSESAVTITASEYLPLISVPYIPKGEDIEKHVRAKSHFTVSLAGASSLASLRQGDIVQLSRKGFFICDEAPNELLDTPMQLIYIPDGKEKTFIAHKDGVSQVTVSAEEYEQLEVEIKLQKAKVLEMKMKKAEKADIKKASESLKKLETFFESIGIEGGEATSAQDGSGDKVTADSQAAVALKEKITEAGNVVRNLKKEGKDIKQALATLQALKAEYKELTGEDATPPSDRKDKKKSKKKQGGGDGDGEQKQKQQKKQAKKPKNKPEKGQTRLGMEFKKADNFPEWYTEVITKTEMIDYYDVSGCYVIRPWAYAIWEIIHDFFDPKIKEAGVKNAYFPIFVSKDRLEKEKDHIEDFAPEVAWVTRSGDSELAKPIAVRPTSETVMYPSFANWIQSHRDLPLKINQWNNVVRWEFKQPTPFLRTREFLWQEGHSAFATRDEAIEEVFFILDLYRQIYEDILAVPVVPGKKTEKEKFAGGDFTTTVEAYIAQNGRAIQGATSHHLGQNFSKMFDINFQLGDKHELVYQNSWGLTTRTIGVMIMVHSDDKGLVLPPRAAPTQVILVTILGGKTKPNDEVIAYADKLKAEFEAAGVRVDVDARDNISSGFKFNHWELRGVPIRVEIGPKDIDGGEFVVCRRDTFEKTKISRNTLVSQCQGLLDDIHANLFAKAKADLDAHKKEITNWDDFVPELNKKNLLVVPFCGEKDCEGSIKKDSEGINPHDPTAPAMGAKSLCRPLIQPQLPEGTKCIRPACKNAAAFWTMFGRSY